MHLQEEFVRLELGEYITELNGECFSRKNPITTIEKNTKPRELYHIGSLFTCTNFDHTQYFNGGAIIPGEFIPNAQLMQNFPNTLESDWNMIKHELKRSPFYNTTRQGRKPPGRHGQGRCPSALPS